MCVCARACACVSEKVRERERELRDKLNYAKYYKTWEGNKGLWLTHK